MTHLTTESDCPSNSLTGEAYLNSRREYWRNEAGKDCKKQRTKGNCCQSESALRYQLY